MHDTLKYLTYGYHKYKLSSTSLDGGGTMRKPKKEARQEVIKHSAAIQIENNITLLQRCT